MIDKRGPAREGVHVARLNFKTSRVSVYKCLSLIVGFAVTVAIWPREVVSCSDFILYAVTTFWAMLLVRILPWQGLTKLNLWFISSVNYEPVPKSLFWVPSCVPGFEYMP